MGRADFAAVSTAALGQAIVAELQDAEFRRVWEAVAADECGLCRSELDDFMAARIRWKLAGDGAHEWLVVEFDSVKSGNFVACMKASQREFEKFENRFSKKSESEKRRGVLKRRKPFLGTVHFIGEAVQACHWWILETYYDSRISVPLVLRIDL